MLDLIKSIRMGLGCTVLIGLLFLVGCQTAPPSPDCFCVSNDLQKRFGQTISCGSTRCGEVITMPPGASLDHPITEDEAVSIALWNNAAFQELLADLGIARGDLIQAGLLPNPDLVYWVQVPEKPFKYLFDFPIESLWLRPIKVKAAAREADRVAEKLGQAGLDLMRDVRQAYADVVLARERVKVAGESVRLRTLIAKKAGVRLEEGDISSQEEATAKIDSLQAEQDATKIGYDVPILTEKLRNLMGIGPWRGNLILDPSPAFTDKKFDADDLTREAKAIRPDALAAAQAVEAAKARLTFVKLNWVRFLGIGDSTSGVRSHVFGPALRMTVPIFNWNQGTIARAEAELEKARRNQETVAYQIILDVQRAYFQYRQACAELEVLRTKVRPEVQEAIRRAQAAYAEGNIPLFIVLETTRQLLDNYLREAVLIGDVRRFWAELERSVGKRLAEPLAPTAESRNNDGIKFELPPTPAEPLDLKPGARDKMDDEDLDE